MSSHHGYNTIKKRNKYECIAIPNSCPSEYTLDKFEGPNCLRLKKSKGLAPWTCVTQCYPYFGLKQKKLLLIVQENVVIDEDVTIKTWWLIWRSATVLPIPTKVKGKLYRIVIRLIMLQRMWAVKVQYIHKMSVVLRWMCSHTRLDKIRNNHIRQTVQTVHI